MPFSDQNASLVDRVRVRLFIKMICAVCDPSFSNTGEVDEMFGLSPIFVTVLKLNIQNIKFLEMAVSPHLRRIDSTRK